MPSVAIGYDSRIKSDVFAKVAAGVFAANGVKVNIWPVLMPVPTVSFATRYLHTSAGVMVTASHNPSKYNGYKVYGADGCQITTEVAAEILAEIEKLDIFADVKTSDFEAGVANGSIQYIPDEVYTAFVEQVKSQSVLFGEEVNKNVAIVYSPLNGTGLKPVTRTLKEMGYTNITVVKEQEQPDGNFPTCPYPNPEIKEAMALGIPDDEVKYYYSATDVCVLPYTDVYQSGVIQLAYGYKKAVVSSDLPAFTQFVKEGKTGYISEAGNPDSLAQAMERAIKDCNRLSDMGEAGYDLVKQTLNWDNLAKKIVDKCY